MYYNFDEPTNRHKTNSYKWDSNEKDDLIPLWVADMDFKTAPPIIEALKKRVEQGIFGYTKVPQEYYDAVRNWFSRRHGWNFGSDEMIYTSGVVPAVSAVIKALTNPGDKVIVQTPVYNCFFSSIRNNGCEVSENELILRDGSYYIDFADLENRASDAGAKVMLLCNPHNPSGRVWTEEELLRIGEICEKNGVTVVSDEIHCELVYRPYKYIPYASLSDHAEKSVVCFSPSKAFNIAGLQIANIVCRNDQMRAKIDKAININEVCDVNPFGVIATIEAYTKGEEWLEALVGYLYENYQTVVDFFKRELPDIPLIKLEGTYLVWMDCRQFNISSERLEERMIDETGVWLNAGSMYGKAGEGFMRINIACQRKRLCEGLERIKKFFSSI